MLLIVGSAAIIFPQLSRFGSDQRLQDAALELQTAIRTAQNNAASGLKCSDNLNPLYRASDWHLSFSTAKNYSIEPSCVPDDPTSPTPSWLPKTNFSLPEGITLEQIYLDSGGSTGSPLPTLPPALTCQLCLDYKIHFSNISAATDFQNNRECNPDFAQKLGIVLKSASGGRSEVFLDKGGSVYLSTSPAPTPASAIVSCDSPLPTPSPAPAATPTVTPTPLPTATPLPTPFGR